MELTDFIRKPVLGEVVDSMTNEKYKEMCKKKVNKEINEIVKQYDESLNESWKYYVG